jgi:hypothetical protein
MHYLLTLRGREATSKGLAHPSALAAMLRGSLTRAPQHEDKVSGMRPAFERCATIL